MAGAAEACAGEVRSAATAFRAEGSEGAVASEALVVFAAEAFAEDSGESVAFADSGVSAASTTRVSTVITIPGGTPDGTMATLAATALVTLIPMRRRVRTTDTGARLHRF
jgi:hypothetical protein